MANQTKELIPDFVIQCDGGSRGNPGPSALGTVIRSKDGSLVREYGEFLGTGTNNEAEYKAVIFALKKLKQLIGHERAGSASIEIRVDSELLERQVNGHFKIQEPRMQDLFVEFWNLKVDFASIVVKHVYREQNKDADRLVNAALDKELNKLL
jgi:ribonuclease HI/probable phosphoglycerate mutase